MLAPLVLFLQFLCKILFKNLLQIVKGTWIRLKEAFSRFEIFSPCLKCFSFDLNKTPPQWNSPLSVQEGFSDFWRYFLPLFEHNKISIWKLYFKIWWWCGPFALGSYFLPLWHESPKTDTCEWNINPFYFLPNGKQINMSEDYTKVENYAEYRQRVDNTDGVEWKRRLWRRLHFPFNSMTLCTFS
jgi:hypothetical protein